MQKPTVKLIELTDQFIDKSTEFPYILAIKSKIRFRLRSKLCYDHQPILLIQRMDKFDYLLPLNSQIDFVSAEITQNFMVLKGKLSKDGAWEVDLPQLQPGVVCYQLVFAQFGSTITCKLGSCDVILLCQDKIDLRKCRLQSVFGRSIGFWYEWADFFRKQKQLGYNAFHLAPISQTGPCHSYYSLKSHVQLSSKIFSGTNEQKINQLRGILQPLQKEGVSFFVDIVLNHTSQQSEWIKTCPDAVYTCKNTPMLHTAFILDQLIYEWGQEVKEMMSFDVEFNEDILHQIQENLKNRIYGLKLHQYFMFSQEMYKVLLGLKPTSKPSENIFARDPVDIIEEFLNKNCSGTTQKPYGIKVNNLQLWACLPLAYQQKDLKHAFQNFNNKWKAKIQNQWIPEMVRNTINQVRYEYLYEKTRSFDDPHPLVDQYFTLVKGYDGDYHGLNNGWVGGDNDSRQLFVESKQYYYLRRRVHTWRVLRIRYGQQPSDSLAAWDHMLQYVKLMAKHFDGFRLDNFHGTPISVARYLIKQARKVNPNILIFAQLFTNLDEQTALFVRQTGVNSLLKQAKNMLNADSFIYYFHNKANVTNPYLGSINRHFIQNGEVIKYAVKKRPISLIYDITHDNQTYITDGNAIVQTPLAFLLSFLGTFTGSTKGYDQFYNKKIYVHDLYPIYKNDHTQPPVIDRTQAQGCMIHYSGPEKCAVFGSWDDWKEAIYLEMHEPSKTQYTILRLPPGQYEYKFISQGNWRLEGLRKHNGNNHTLVVNKVDQHRTTYRNLQALRRSVAKKCQKYLDFKEYHVYSIGNNVLVFRQSSDHLQSICTIANLFHKASTLYNTIQLQGKIEDTQIWLQTDLMVNEGQTTKTEVIFSKNLNEFFDITYDQGTGSTFLKAPFMPPGFVCFIHFKKSEAYRQAINNIDRLMAKPFTIPPIGPLEINGLFFNSNNQEEELWGQSCYTIPQAFNHQMVYAGFAGAFEMVLRAKKISNLNEGIFQNLRQGNWLLDYYINRVRRYEYIQHFSLELQNTLKMMKTLPRYLIPKYFSQFIYKLMLTVRQKFKGDTDFQKSLIFSSCEFINYFPTCSFADKTLFAVGLPHFAIGWARCWGRDTFISTDILRLYPNIFRQVILQYASALRHGLIPNLLDQGNNPRYNSRDATWWFVRGVIEYIQATKDYEILQNKVEMIFFSNDKAEHLKRKHSNQKKRIMLLWQIILQIFQAHANGNTFREWDAGYEIDCNMNTDGFNINLQTDFQTGFIMGGNAHNCLTWMDKMGTSVLAGNKGTPSTPRAGSPVELVGLLYYCLIKFDELSKQGLFKFLGVEAHGQYITFREWADKIKQNFDLYYFLKDICNYKDPFIRGIYKDLVNSPIHYDQQRFRPNALIALAVAPQLCDKEHAISYIKKVEKHLLDNRSIGVSTLAQMHSPYSPRYQNTNDSNDYNVAHGFSYHNGPEWVWLYGFYLVAKVNFQSQNLNRRRMMALLQQHIKCLQNSEWFSLPQLTNKNGQFNQFSCGAQAWSVSSILMALRKMEILPDQN